MNADAEKQLIPNGDPDGPVQLHFYLGGQFPNMGYGSYEGSWRGRSFAEIPTKVYDSAARSFAGFIFERGCAVQYVTVEDLTIARSIDIPCIPERTVRLHATILNLDEAGSGDLVADVRYQAIHEQWIEESQMRSDTIMGFQLGWFPIGEDQSMTIVLPDFGNDPTLSTHLKHGQYQICVYRAHGPEHVGELVVPHRASEAQRYLPVFSHYPETVVLQFTADNQFVWN